LTVLEGSVETCFKIMGAMSQRLRGLIKEIDDLTLQSATTRLCAMLWRQAGESGDSDIELTAPKGVLASRLSIKPETFSRILHNLADMQLLEVKGAHIRIKDIAQLQQLAQPASLVGLTD
jgi:CRP-like cAMP-binding protein